ncbi:MAG: sulfite exporter TauE/SafE family protein [Bacteroidales bacterium]|jgi:uncharacterized membrane protein YfcA|nr:sulfite exporter TauE/SafE family protein [Bacteroidales bacterium]
MDLTWVHVVLLISSGLIVGFVNTLAGGGTVISLFVFMLLGLPPNMANGTNRIAVFLQNITAVVNFSQQKIIDWQKAFRLAIPIIIGSLFGALFANKLPNELFRYVFGTAIVLFALLLIFQPNRWLKNQDQIPNVKIKWYHYLIFFVIGIYGGFLHVGIGYMILFALILGLGCDLVRANALKNFLVMAYIPFSLVIFIFQGNVCWTYGLIHAIGNIIGAQIGAMLAIKKGAPLIRWMMIILIFVVILQLFGFIDPTVFADWLKN